MIDTIYSALTRAIFGFEPDADDLIVMGLGCFILFYLGRFVGKLTRNIGFFKGLTIFILVAWFYQSFSQLPWFWLAAFFAGVLANHALLIARILFWAQSIGEAIWAIRHRKIYEDLRRQEQEAYERQRQDRKAWHEAKQRAERQKPSSTQAKPKKPDKKLIAHYMEVLGFHPDEVISAKLVQKAFRRLAMTYHPDMPNGSAAKFKEIVTARDYLVGIFCF